MRYVAIDPGETTGIAAYEPDRKHLEEGESHWMFHQVGPNPHHEWLESYLFDFDPDVLICERFDYRRKADSVILTSVEYIGVVKLYHQKARGTCKLVMQAPRVGNGLFPHAVIKKLGLWQPIPPGHQDANDIHDALAHMLYYLTTEEKNHTWVHQLRSV